MRKKIKEILKKPPKLNHLRLITTKDGILQHSIGSIPDPKMGYSIDDNTRALIDVLEYERLYKDKSLFDSAKIYLNFIEKAQTEDHKFHNFKSYKGDFLDEEGSEDSFGRTIWALGYAIGNRKINLEFKKKARVILKRSLSNVLKITSPRSLAFSLLGLYWIKDGERTKILADKLIDLYKKNQSPKWEWFEKKLTYSNAILPLSLFLAYNLTKDQRYLKVAKESFDFLLKTCEEDGTVSTIGQVGWYKKGSKKSLFDQQPVDPADMVICSSWAYRITKEEKYLKNAFDWFGWFYGGNIGKKIMVDSKTGGVFDGLKMNSINQNQGAESVVCYLLAHMSLAELVKNQISKIKSQNDNSKFKNK